jgi:hypothetical protein
MSTWISVARYHLADRVTYLVYPWAIQAFVFVVNLVIFATTPGPAPGQARYAGALATIYIVFGLIGTWSIIRRLPFALALGVSRRSYYAGTALMAVGLAAVYALVLAVLQPIERATGGWGLDLHFFRVPYLLAGPWYLTWLTSFVGLVLMFGWGVWFGLVYQRWNVIGVLAFGAVQIVVLTAALIIAARDHAWRGLGHFFITLSIAGLTGLLAVLAVALLAGGYATVRRVTV